MSLKNEFVAAHKLYTPTTNEHPGMDQIKERICFGAISSSLDRTAVHSVHTPSYYQIWHG
jgi:hypothetical protein